MAPPSFDEDLGFGKAEEDLPVEQFVAQVAVEAFAVAILPRATGFDVGRLRTDGGNPVPQASGDEFWTIVGSDIGWRPLQDHQIRQCFQHVGRVEPPFDPNGQSFVGELVDDAEHAELPPIMGPVFDEVIGPDMVGPLWPQAHA